MEADRARALLAEERERVERAIAKLGAGDEEALAAGDQPGDQDDEELYEEELDEGLGEDLAEQLRAVERAEARLAAGTYGISTQSGEPIPDERLQARPTAELTFEEELRERG